MKATCGDESCGRSWTLQKSPEQYSEGSPRCPECGNRDVEIEDDGAGEATPAAIFDALADGAEPVDLVREHGLDPAEARQFLDDWESLSDTVVLTEDELDERVETAHQEAEAEAREAIERERERAARAEAQAEGEIARLQRRVAELKREVGEEWRAGVREGTSAAEAVCKERIEAAREEVRAELAEEFQLHLTEYHEGAEAELRELGEELESERAERRRLEERLAAFEDSDEAAIYAAGHRDGSRSPAIAEVARSDGMLEAARALVR